MFTNLFENSRKKEHSLKCVCPISKHFNSDHEESSGVRQKQIIKVQFKLKLKEHYLCSNILHCVMY